MSLEAKIKENQINYYNKQEVIKKEKSLTLDILQNDF
jgi:hypothetical protein